MGLQVGFSHLRELKFKHNFNVILNVLCSCRSKLNNPYMNDLRNIDDSLPVLNNDNLRKLLLYGKDLFDDNKS